MQNCAPAQTGAQFWILVRIKNRRLFGVSLPNPFETLLGERFEVLLGPLGSPWVLACSQRDLQGDPKMAPKRSQNGDLVFESFLGQGRRDGRGTS